MSRFLRDMLRLEIDRQDIPNLVDNHSGQAVTTGWRSPDSTATISRKTDTAHIIGAGRHAIIANRAGSAMKYTVQTPLIPVTPGRLVAAGVSVGPVATVPAGRFDHVTLAVIFYASDGSTVVTGGRNFGGRSVQPPDDRRAVTDLNFQYHSDPSFDPLYVPNNAAFARMEMTYERGIISTPTKEAPAALYFTRAYLYNAPASEPALVRAPKWTDPTVTPLDLLGMSNEIVIERGARLDGVTHRLETGTIEATIANPAADPASNARMRAGRPLRVSALHDGVWKPLASGTVKPLHAAYRKKTGAVVSIAAADAVARAVDTTVVGTYYGGRDAAWVNTMYDSGARWDVDYAYPINQPAGAGSYDQTNVAEAIDLAAATFNDYAWVDKRDMWCVRDTLPTAPAYVFTDNAAAGVARISYVDIDADFGTDALTNELTVTRQNADENTGEGETEKVYGPYINEASVAEWGRSSADLAISGGDPWTRAKEVLATFDTPARSVRSVKFAVVDEQGRPIARHLAAAVNLELYQAVRVQYADAAIDSVVRVLSIKHEIDGYSWFVTLTFTPLGANPSNILVTPPFGGTDTGPSDISRPSPGLISTRTRSTGFAVPNNSETTVPLNVVRSEQGIGYDDANSRWVIPRDGRYLLSSTIGFPQNANGIRIGRLKVNGSTVDTDTLNSFSGTANVVHTGASEYLNKGDVVSVTAQQNSGGSLSVAGLCVGSVVFIGP